MSTPSRVSVIIPSLNRKPCVVNLISDLMEQTLEPSEIIVVDQSDIPYELTGCVYVHDVGRGPCRAKNKGIELATGDILVFLDDDIRIDSTFLKKLCFPIIEGRFEAVSGAFCDANGNYQFSDCRKWQYPSQRLIQAITSQPGHSGQCLTLGFTAGCSAITRKAIDVVGCFDPFYDPDGAGEDRDMGLRLFHHGFAILYNGSAKANHLGLLSGGRRAVKDVYKVNPIEGNMLYIVKKFFSDEVFTEYARNWQFEFSIRKLSWHPITWYKAIRRLSAARKHILSINNMEIKVLSGPDFRVDIKI